MSEPRSRGGRILGLDKHETDGFAGVCLGTRGVGMLFQTVFETEATSDSVTDLAMEGVSWWEL